MRVCLAMLVCLCAAGPATGREKGKDCTAAVHFNVTTHPYAEWTAQQIAGAF